MSAMTDHPPVSTALAAGERETREFKQTLDTPESVAGEIVAFANSSGGALYVGVNDDGQVVGLTNAETTWPDHPFVTPAFWARTRV
jgi:predicted HTH transcriptional regulator